MKYVLLSHDDELSVYSVPDIVAENLNDYCSEFADKWLWTSPYAKKYQTVMGVSYGSHGFIEYLNERIFPDTSSVLIETFSNVWDSTEVPEEYKECAWFNF